MPMTFIKVKVEVASLAVYVFKLGDKHLYLWQKLIDIERLSKLYCLDESFFKLYSKNLSGIGWE